MTEHNKYLVFKRDELLDVMQSDIVNEALIYALEDAVVIRTQDIFASGVLWGYVNAVQAAIELMTEYPLDESGFTTVHRIEQLEETREYFATMARQADDAKHKLPD